MASLDLLKYNEQKKCHFKGEIIRMILISNLFFLFGQYKKISKFLNWTLILGEYFTKFYYMGDNTISFILPLTWSLLRG